MEYRNAPKSIRPVTLREPNPYTNELEGCDQLNLSRSEIDFFKEHGFIVKRGLITEQTRLARIVDYVWECVPRSLISRDDLTTWTDQASHRWSDEDNRQIGRLHQGMWKMRSPHAVGTENFIVDWTANHPNVRAVVEQFLRPPIKRSERVRGVYVILPKPVDQHGRLGPHADHAAAQLCAMVLIDDVIPHGGGFTVWPGSHLRLHTYWETIVSAHWKEDAKESFAEEQADILNTVEPIEFCGQAGDVVFWHPRLLHSAGVNKSVELGDPRIRYVVPCDFQTDGNTLYDDDVFGPSEKEQWWVDTRHFTEDVVSTDENIWHGWLI